MLSGIPGGLFNNPIKNLMVTQFQVKRQSLLQSRSTFVWIKIKTIDVKTILGIDC